CQQNYTWNTF
nr:immunoglobulin light chain junction region [Macaca mulatta]